MKDYKRITITSALPYANGPVHIGHLAGVYVPADIYARYNRLKHRDVLFIGGSDEHGVPVTLKARKEGVTPQDIVDRYHKILRNPLKNLAFRSIFTVVQVQKYTIRLHQNSSFRFTTRVNSLKRLRCSSTTSRSSSSLPTATLWELVLSAVPKMPRPVRKVRFVA